MKYNYNSLHLKYDSKKNTLKIFHNKSGFDQAKVKWLNFETENSLNGVNFSDTSLHIAYDSNSQSFLGLRLQNVLDTRSINYKGITAEDAFKQLLIENNIPCLYVGQGLNFSERNSTIKYCENNITLKRPDFLASFPELGNIFIDVKCRSKKRYPNPKTKKDEEVFYIQYEEIKKLYELRNYLNVPVWIAFTDSKDYTFWLCSIKILENIRTHLVKRYPNIDDPDKRRTQHMRIPNNILSNMKENSLLTNLISFDIDEYVSSLIHFETNADVDEKYLISDELNKK